MATSASRFVRFANSPDDKLSIYVRMQARELRKDRHEQMCGQDRCQGHPHKAAHALITPKDASPVVATTLPSGPQAPGPPRPQLSSGSPRAAFRTRRRTGVRTRLERQREHALEPAAVGIRSAAEAWIRTAKPPMRYRVGQTVPPRSLESSWSSLPPAIRFCNESMEISPLAWVPSVRPRLSTVKRSPTA